MITVNEVNFEFNSKNELFTQQLYSQWDSFCRTSFEHVIDSVLSRFDISGDVIRLEALDLDLGTIPEDDFQNIFSKRLEEKLKEIFSALLDNPQNYSKQIQIIPTGLSLIEKLAYFLQHGYFPYETEVLDQSIEALFNELLEKESDALKAFILTTGGQDKIRERLVYQLSDQTLEALVFLIEPAESQFINAYSRMLISIYPHTGHPEISRQNFRDAVKNLILAYLLYPNRGYFNRKQFVQQTIYNLARRYNIAVLQLIDILSHEIKAISAGNALIPELFQILTDLRKDSGLDKPDISPASTIQTQTMDLDNELETKGVPQPTAYPWPSNLAGMSQTVDDAFENRNRLISINNAGIVLLAPFFPRLFLMMDYLSEDRKQFKDKETHQRVIFALQALLSDNTTFTETDLTLNKLLTGYPLEAPVPSNIELTEKERNTINDFCSSVLNYWEKMKNTSLEGFKAGFLKRNGKLEDLDRYWLLTVEKKAYDILLESLPWSFQLIRFPFSEKLIKVEWR